MSKVTEVKEETVETEVNNVTNVDESKEKKPGKVRRFLGWAKRKAKKSLPYVGAFVAGAGTVIGAAIVLTRGSNCSEVALIEKDDDVIPVDEYLEAEEETE